MRPRLVAVLPVLVLAGLPSAFQGTSVASVGPAGPAPFRGYLLEGPPGAVPDVVHPG